MNASLKKNILIGLAAAAGFFLFTALGIYLFFILQFSVYHDDINHFSIKYPNSWKVIVNPQKGVAVEFLRPKDTALDTVQENFNVTIQPIPPYLHSLAEFSARIKDQMTTVFPNIKYVEDKPVQFGWREGHMTVINAPEPDHLVLVNAWVLVIDQSYILTYLGDMHKYTDDSIYIKEMIRSFQIQ